MIVLYDTRIQVPITISNCDSPLSIVISAFSTVCIRTDVVSPTWFVYLPWENQLIVSYETAYLIPKYISYC